MKILFIGGTHPRHLYYLNEIAERFDVVGALVQQRANMMPQPPEEILPADASLWLKHFVNRAVKEMEYFGDPLVPDMDHLMIRPDELNTMESARYVQRHKPDVVLIFGCGMIRQPLRDALPPHTYNLHLGLSPRYRGAATLFWPFYFLEPNWAGTTLHRIVHEPDAGDIAHQTRPELKWKDTIHDVSARAVVAATKDVIRVLDVLSWAGGLELFPQRATGKNFLASDFQPAHLRLIYETYQDDIVDAYLSGELMSPEPKLRKQIWQPEAL